MPNTINGYGTIHLPVTTVTGNGTTTLLAAIPGYRYELDSYKIEVVALDAGSIKLGFNTNADSPEVFYTESTQAMEYKYEFASPGYGNTTNLTGEVPVNLIITGSTNANVRVTVGYHIVRMMYPNSPS